MNEFPPVARHCQPRESKAEVLAAASSQYVRRGKPAESTAWSPSEIHQFMKWQFNEHRCGRLSRKKLGGWSWSLPKKSASGEPAPLPDEDQKFLKRDTKPAAKDSSPSQSPSGSSKSADSDDKPERSKKEFRVDICNII